MMKKQQHMQSVIYDVQLLFPVLFLVGIGIVMVYSASSTLALKKFGTSYFFLKKQALFAFAGVIVLVISRHFPYKYYRMLAYPLLGLAMTLLAVIQFTDLGLAAGGSIRWMKLGSFSFQPSELARIALVIYLAYSMEKKGEQIKNFSVGFVPHVLVLGVFAALIFIQPDFGSVAILGALTWIMLFIGGVRFSQLFASLLIIFPAEYLFLINAEYRS